MILLLTTTVPFDDLDIITLSTCVYFKYDTDKYSLLSLVGIGLMTIVAKMILLTVLIKNFIIILTMFLWLLTVVSALKENCLLSGGMPITTVQLPKDLIIVTLNNSSSSVSQYVKPSFLL